MMYSGCSPANHIMILELSYTFYFSLRLERSTEGGIPIVFRQPYIPEEFIDHGFYARKAHWTGYRDRYTISRVRSALEFQNVFTTKSINTLRCSQNISPYWITVKNKIFEIIKNPLTWTVQIAVNFVFDYLFFFFKFLLREGAAKHDITDQVHGSSKICFQEACMNDCFFLGRISIEFTADIIKPREYVVRFAFRSTLEEVVFYEMRESLLMF